MKSAIGRWKSAIESPKISRVNSISIVCMLSGDMAALNQANSLSHAALRRPEHITVMAGTNMKLTTEARRRGETMVPYSERSEESAVMGRPKFLQSLCLCGESPAVLQ